MVHVVTESTSDIPADMAERLGITVVASYVVFGSEAYRDGIELTREEFYAKLDSTKEIPTTATPPPADYEQVYRQLAHGTDEIISIHAAARLSGLYGVATLAAQSVPEARIEVVDSEQVSMGCGWIAIAAAEAAQRGESMQNILSLIEDIKTRTRLIAVLDTLEFIYRGGRVGWAQAVIGTLMRIKPILEVRRGEIKLLERARTQSRALSQLLAWIQALGPLERAMVMHANAPGRADQLATQLQEIAPGWEPLIGQAGMTMASHAGPGTVAIACIVQ